MSTGSPEVSNILHQVCKLHHKEGIGRYLLKSGLDDYDPLDWNEVRALRTEGLVIPDVDGFFKQGEGEKGDEGV